MKRKRRRINAAGYQRAMQVARTFKEMRTLVDLYHGMVLAMNRDGDMRLIRRMAGARERMLRLLDGMCPPIPELIPVSELEVIDIHVEQGTPYCNFAIVHRGRILKDGFQTQPVAWQYIKHNITEPGEIAVAVRHRHEVIELDPAADHACQATRGVYCRRHCHRWGDADGVRHSLAAVHLKSPMTDATAAITLATAATIYCSKRSASLFNVSATNSISSRLAAGRDARKDEQTNKEMSAAQSSVCRMEAGVFGEPVDGLA